MHRSAVELLEAGLTDGDDDCTVDKQLSQDPADPEPLLVERLVVIPDEGAIRLRRSPSCGFIMCVSVDGDPLADAGGTVAELALEVIEEQLDRVDPGRVLRVEEH